MSLPELSLVLTNVWDLISDRQDEGIITKNDLSTYDVQDRRVSTGGRGEN